MNRRTPRLRVFFARSIRRIERRITELDLIMKVLAKCLWALVAGSCGCVSAALSYDYSGSALAIPDNTGSGVAFNFSLSDQASSITALSVTLNISGGYNGDLYAYLSHGAGFAVLLNRAGIGVTTAGSSAGGYANTGFSITFDSSASGDLHFYQNAGPAYNGSGQLTGTWRPDGRGIDPESAPTAFDSPGTANFNTFNGVNPNGNWTLFLADVSGGAVSTLNDFSNSVTAVPEPVNAALAAFAGITIIVSLLFRRPRNHRRAPRSQ